MSSARQRFEADEKRHEPSKVAQFDFVGSRVDEKVLWLDVSVADAHAVQVVEAA